MKLPNWFSGDTRVFMLAAASSLGTALFSLLTEYGVWLPVISCFIVLAYYLLRDYRELIGTGLNTIVYGVVYFDKNGNENFMRLRYENPKAKIPDRVMMRAVGVCILLNPNGERTFVWLKVKTGYNHRRVEWKMNLKDAPFVSERGLKERGLMPFDQPENPDSWELPK